MGLDFWHFEFSTTKRCIACWHTGVGQLFCRLSFFKVVILKYFKKLQKQYRAAFP